MRKQEKLIVGLLLAVVSIYYGCSTELQHGLNEDQANEVLVVLQQNGVNAEKAREEGETPTWTIKVPKEDAAKSWRLMKEHDLPRLPEKGLSETFGTGSLIPTATEEKALFMSATCNELQKTIESIDGVVKARVHLVLPEPQILPEDNTDANRPKAAVLIKYRMNSRGEVPYKDDSIKTLVSNAISKLDPKDVVVIGTEVLDAGNYTNPGGAPAVSFTQFGPIKVSTDSEFAFKAIAGGVLLCIGILAIGLVLQARKSSNLRNEMNKVRQVPARKAS